MQNRKKILLGAACGAVIGALATLLRGQVHSVPSFFTVDQAVVAHRPLLWAAIAGWVLFSLYWEVAARGAAKAQSSESGASRGFHVFVTNAALLLEIAWIRGLGRFLPVSVLIMSAGLAVEAMGLFLAIWARHHLGRNWSGEITIKVDHELIRSGPYKLLRHPIYTGILMMYVGTAVVTGEWLAILGLFMVTLAYWRKIRLEESNLNLAFGADYDAYRREAWALVPGVF